MSPIQWKLVHTRQTGFQPHVYFIFDKIVDICSNILESKIKGLLNRKKSSWNKNLASSIWLVLFFIWLSLQMNQWYGQQLVLMMALPMYELLVFGNRRGISIFWFHRFSSIGNHIGDNLSQILRKEIIDLEHCLLSQI